MHGAGVGDMQQTPLRLSDDPDSMLRWSLDIAKEQIVLKLCGSRHQMKVGIVTAVAEGSNGQVLLQSLLSVTLLYPGTYSHQGQIKIKPLPLSFSEYNTFWAVDVANQPAATEQVLALPRTQQACAPFLISLGSDRFSFTCLSTSLEAPLVKAHANAALCVATALAHSGQEAGKASAAYPNVYTSRVLSSAFVHWVCTYMHPTVQSDLPNPTVQSDSQTPTPHTAMAA